MWQSIKNWFSNAKKALNDYFSHLFAGIQANGGQILLNVTKEIVLELAKSAMPGESKLKIALNAIETTFMKNGIPYLEAAARGAIEAVVATLPKQAKKIAAAAAQSIPVSNNKVVDEALSVIKQGITAASAASTMSAQ